MTPAHKTEEQAFPRHTCVQTPAQGYLPRLPSRCKCYAQHRQTPEGTGGGQEREPTHVMFNPIWRTMLSGISSRDFFFKFTKLKNCHLTSSFWPKSLESWCRMPCADHSALQEEKQGAVWSHWLCVAVPRYHLSSSDWQKFNISTTPAGRVKNLVVPHRGQNDTASTKGICQEICWQSYFSICPWACIYDEAQLALIGPWELIQACSQVSWPALSLSGMFLPYHKTFPSFPAFLLPAQTQSSPQGFGERLSLEMMPPTTQQHLQPYLQWWNTRNDLSGKHERMVGKLCSCKEK